MRHIFLAGMAGVALSTAVIPAVAADYQQSPILDEAVKSGALPPVAERVGADPRVLTPVHEVGHYGGTLRGGMVGGTDRNMLFTNYGWEPLLTWDPSWTGKVFPNVASSFSASEDGKSFTFKLRQGMKWSDGTPFTSDDVAFFINDVLNDPQILGKVAAKPGWLFVQGEGAKIEVKSPTEFTIFWSKPNGLFLLNAASTFGVQLNLLSKHYCGQFMPKYNPKAEDLAKEAGTADWIENFKIKCGIGIEEIERWRNPERPTLEAWKIVNPYVAGATRVTFERNPYYWKVDTAGNQLPYIDKVSVSVNADAQTLLLSVLAGEIDYESRHTNTSTNLPVLSEGQERGDFIISPREARLGNQIAISVNMNSADPVKGPIFANKDFRVALSESIDRQAIIDTVYLAQGKPRQVSPVDGTPYANEKLATQYLDFNIEEANKLLDGLGLDKRGSNGLRLGPDGKPFVVNVAVITALSNYGDVAELLVQYWQAIGIDARVSTMDRTRFYEEKTASKHDIVLWGATGGGIDVLLDPRDYFPFSAESNFAIEWGKKYLGSGGQEAPAAVKEQWSLYDQIKGTTDVNKQAELWQKIVAISADQFYTLGITAPIPTYAVVSKKLGNVTEKTPFGFIHPDPGSLNPEQFYLKQ